jgi:hypothetical protein
MAAKVVRIGSGSGWSNDRISPAKELVEKVALDYLLFETMAEQTSVMALDRRAVDPTYPGYEWFLDERIDAVLETCHRQGTRIVSNQGWTNPKGAQERYLERGREMGLTGLRVAAVTYDDIKADIFELGDVLMDEREGEPISVLADRDILCVEPYNGADGITSALDQGAGVVVTGKISDPSLAIGPLVHEFGWKTDDELATAGVVGIMLECGASGVCGGFLADPPHFEIPGIRDGLGFPYIEVSADGEMFISKAPGTGGFVSSLGCRSTIIREIFDPASYIDPNVTMDITGVEFEDVAPHRVRMSGARGKPAPDKLKVNIMYADGFIWQDFAYYAGPRAVARARLNAEILETQLRKGNFTGQLRFDLIGYDAMHGSVTPPGPEPWELVLRVAAKSDNPKELSWVGNEFDAVGPCGVGGTGKGIAPAMRVKRVTALASTLVPRSAVHQHVFVEEV